MFSVPVPDRDLRMGTDEDCLRVLRLLPGQQQDACLSRDFLPPGSIITLPALSPRVPRLRCFVNGSFVSIIHFYVTGSNLLACDVLIICVHIQSWSEKVRYKRKSG